MSSAQSFLIELKRRSFLAGAAAAGITLFPHRSWAQDENPATPQMIARSFPQKMSFLDNSQIRIGVNLAVGGAITYLADATRPDVNLVNSFDLGRQIQMSYYSGPVPYRVAGHAGPKPVWEHIGWNPIQVGDDFGNFSKIVDHYNNGEEIYVKCIPMHWPLDNVPAECFFESWIRLDGKAALVRSRLSMARADKTQWAARTQELPAVYTNGLWHNLWTYKGDRPFESDRLSKIEHPFKWDSPWAEWSATERWAAQIDQNGHGLGVWNAATTSFSGGFYGEKGVGGPNSPSTGYISPTRKEIIDHNIVHRYDYAIIAGRLEDIRSWVYDRPRPPRHPSWQFALDRDGWTYANAVDQGWPINGHLDIRPARAPAKAQIISPPTAWHAENASSVDIRAAFYGDVGSVQMLWKQLNDNAFVQSAAAQSTVVPDGTMRTISINLGKSTNYRGLITQLGIQFEAKSDNARMVLENVSLRR